MTRTKFALMLALIVVLAAFFGWPAKDEATPAALQFGDGESVSRGAPGRSTEPRTDELTLPGSAEPSREVAGEAVGSGGLAASASELASLNVRVLGENGPEVACRVTLWRSEFDFETALCDDEGRCTVEGLKPGVVWKVDLTEPAFLKTVRHEPLTFSAGEERAAVYFLGEGLQLSGILKDEDGRPVPNHEVRMMRRDVYSDVGDLEDMSSAEARVATTTDEGGQYDFEYVGRGNWWIWPASLEAPGVAASLQVGLALNLPEGVSRFRQPLVARAPRSIRGMVLGVDGAAAANIRVVATAVGELEWQASIESDELGEFQLAGLPPGDFELVAQDFVGGPDFGDARVSFRSLGQRSNSQRSERLLVSSGAHSVVLRLLDIESASAKILSRLVEEGSKSGLAGGVTLRRAGRRNRGYQVPHTADEDGHIEISSIDPGSYILTAHAAEGSLLSTPLEVELESREELDLGEIELHEAVPARVEVVGASERGTLEVRWKDQHIESHHTAMGVAYELNLPRGRFTLSWRSTRALPATAALDTTSGVEQRVVIRVR